MYQEMQLYQKAFSLKTDNLSYTEVLFFYTEALFHQLLFLYPRQS